jgi:Ring finger domain
MEGRCGADTISGSKCKVKIQAGQERCWIHRGPQCSVCFCPMATQVHNRTLDCGHTFHSRCLERWKRTCTTPDPTCPMCRVPFDVPTYRCRLIIERVADGQREAVDFDTSNVSQITDGFGIEFRNLIPSHGRFYTDIQFDVDPEEALLDILTELGLPRPPTFS